MFNGVGKRGLVIALGVGVALAAVGSVSWAAIPAADGVISGCYEKRLGVLRVIDTESGKACTQHELPLSWNRQGPKGEPGPQGESGKLALAGETCPAGEFVTGFDAAGELTCSPPPSATPGFAVLSPTGLDFGSVAVGEALVASVQITNVGGTELEVAPIQITHVPEFRVSSMGCSSLGPGATCLFGIRFAPTAPGTYVATFVVAGVELTAVGVAVA